MYIYGIISVFSMNYNRGQRNHVIGLKMKDFVGKYGEWALVTGGSAGIGLEFAHQLASAGMNLVLVARRAEVLSERAKELAKKFKIEVIPVVKDLTLDNAVEDLYHELSNRDIGLVVLNAGTEVTGHFTHTPLENHIRLTRLNVDVPMRMAHLFGRAMVTRKRGGLVFLSSLFGYQGVPLVASYAASKAYVLSFGEALNVELKPHGVDVLVLSPGLTDTDMPAQMPVDFGKLPMLKSTPSKVVGIALHALGRKATVVPGFTNKFYAWENRLIPRSWPVKLFGMLLKFAMHKSAREELLIHKDDREIQDRFRAAS